MNYDVASLFYSSIEQFHDKDALVIPEKGWTITYSQLGRGIECYRRLLNEKGIGSEETVVLLMPNSVEWILLYFALIFNGTRVVCIDYQFTSREVVEIVEQTVASLLITIPNEKKSDLWWHFETGQNQSMFLVSDGPVPGTDEQYIPTWQIAIESYQPVNIQPSDGETVLITYRGTGYALPVLHSGKSMLASIMANNDVTGIDSDLVIPLLLPLTHIFALTCNLLSPLSVGGTVILISTMRPAGILDMMAEWKCTFLLTVPPMARVLLNQARRWNGKLTALQHGILGGSRVSVEEQQRFNKRFDCLLVEGYGLTETAPVICNRYDNNILSTIGSAMLNVETRIVRSGEDVQRGVLFLKSPTLFDEYIGNPALYSSLIVDGWFDTGDIVEQREDGILRFVECEKVIAKTGGFTVDPNEVIRIIKEYQGVKGVIISMVEDSLWGERLACQVECNGGISEEQLRGYLRERLVGYKMPLVIDIMD